MNDNAKKWVAALRSGKYQQGKHDLCVNEKYCCLGVLSELAAAESVTTVVTEENGKKVYGGRFDKWLPPEVQRWAGLTSDTAQYDSAGLVGHNDQDGKTFTEIADIIESQPEGLFVKEVSK